MRREDVRIHSRGASSDGRTLKYRQMTDDGFLVETTYIDHDKKHIICFSSQVGCPIGCHFCASGQRKDEKRFRQSLSAAELILQCENVVADRALLLDGRPILFSCMGEGEPFLNISAVVSAFAYFGDKYPLGRGALSTSGIFPERIREFAEHPIPMPMKLQISLHAPTDTLRRLLIPRTAPLDRILSAVEYYTAKSGDAVEWNYVLLCGVNDSLSHAERLIALLPSRAHVKLNRFNADPRLPFLASSAETQRRFAQALEEGSLVAEFYQTNGSDIGAGCGQLTYTTTVVAPPSVVR